MYIKLMEYAMKVFETSVDQRLQEIVEIDQMQYGFSK